MSVPPSSEGGNYEEAVRIADIIHAKTGQPLTTPQVKVLAEELRK